ncbi:hypothetical protein Pint_16741 [Pistacia integerrima]|uniref:Uncharacterized protein n=1 Tax=Pistacia integerrima TaxID=434235 RepID=A0ACC0ZDC8_9ROSI|nr:hypothetical protein Pint_16741 [Pistacia integerrima]
MRSYSILLSPHLLICLTQAEQLTSLVTVMAGLPSRTPSTGVEEKELHVGHVLDK